MRAIPRGTVRISGAQARAALATLAGRPPVRAPVAAFEAATAAFLGPRHAIAVGSGKAALALVLSALRCRPGDGVVLASFGVPEVPSLVRGMGLAPRFADVDRDTLGLSPDAAAEAAGGGAAVVLATHLYGNPADLDRLGDVADRAGASLVEDLAQALGARWRGMRVGSVGRAGILSFGHMKNLTALGGGMAVTSDDDLADRMRRGVADLPVPGATGVLAALATAGAFRVATRPPAFDAAFPLLRAVEAASPALLYGLAKMRPPEWETGSLDPRAVLTRMHPAQAACGLAGLDGVDADAAVRARNATRLRGALAGVEDLLWQEPLPRAEPAWTQVVVRVRDREGLKRRLLAHGVDTTWGYLRACHAMPGMPAPAARCPESDAAERENLYIPAGPDLSDRDVDRVAEAVRAAVR